MAQLGNMKIKHLDDGSVWARILWHDVTAEKQWFTNATEVADCDLSNRYSKMGIVDKFKSNKVTLKNLIARPKSGATNFASSAVATTGKYPGGVGLQITATADVSEITANGTKQAYYTPGHIYYMGMDIHQDTKVGGAQFYWKVAEPSFGGSKAVTGNKQWTRIGFRRGPEGIISKYGADWDAGNYTYRIDFDNGKVAGTMKYDGLMLIDLTEAFDAGNEPSQEWCDKYIPYFEDTITIEAPEISTGWYEFMLTYPKISDILYNRWRQTSSANASTVTGYEPIEIAWERHSAGIRKNGSSSVYNCDSGSTWYAALGQITGWTSGSLTNQMPAANHNPTTEVELWVRIDNLSSVQKTNIYEDLFTSKDFKEF